MLEHGTDQDYPPGQPDPRPKTVTQTGLKARGWTDKMVRELLGEPDERRPNTRYPTHADLRLCLLSRVEEAERTDAFLELLDQSEKRKAAGAKAATQTQAVRLAQTTDQVEGFEIVLPALGNDELVRLACESYNTWVTSKGVEREPATPERDEWFLQHISVNFLRQGVPGYRELYGCLLRQPGAAEGQRRGGGGSTSASTRRLPRGIPTSPRRASRRPSASCFPVRENKQRARRRPSDGRRPSRRGVESRRGRSPN